MGRRRQDGRAEQFTIGAQQTPIRTSQLDHVIAWRSLDAMKDDGTAVLLIGSERGSQASRSDKYNEQQNRGFFKNLYENYTVDQHFTIDGGLYSRQGAGFPIDVIRIRGRGRSQRRLPAADVPPMYLLNMYLTAIVGVFANVLANLLCQGGRLSGRCRDILVIQGGHSNGGKQQAIDQCQQEGIGLVRKVPHLRRQPHTPHQQNGRIHQRFSRTTDDGEAQLTPERGSLHLPNMASESGFCSDPLTHVGTGERVCLGLDNLPPVIFYQDPSQCSAYTAKRLGGGEAAGDEVLRKT